MKTKISGLAIKESQSWNNIFYEISKIFNVPIDDLDSDKYLPLFSKIEKWAIINRTLINKEIKKGRITEDIANNGIYCGKIKVKR